jgi:hypothetical protein
VTPYADHRWTTSADVTEAALRLWERGITLREVVLPSGYFPLRLSLRKPKTSELGDRFGEVRSWIAELRATPGYQVEMTEIKNRQLGANQIPKAVWISSPFGASVLANRQPEFAAFQALVDVTKQRIPELLPWLARYPLQVLELAQSWTLLLDVVDWLAANPRPNIYLRQVDIPGVHTKFIEDHQSVLAQLFDYVLPPEAIDSAVTDRNGFCRRYGFREKPSLVRFRLLDPNLRFAQELPLTDEHHAFTSEDFSHLRGVTRVFMTENEINFLAFPPVKDSIVIFGAGFGFSFLAAANWLQHVPIHYWGDIDTYGFVILDQLRAELGHAQSLLMDLDTLLAHKPQWGFEPSPARQDLYRLTSEELQLYNDLRDNRIQPNLRLEQERIGFTIVAKAVEATMT